MSKYPDIGIIVAMKGEADILAAALGFRESRPRQGTYLRYLSSHHSSIMLTPGVDPEFTPTGMTVSRVGKVSAGVITTVMVKQYRPRVIINCGTAGGIRSMSSASSPCVHVGDVVIADSIANHDIDIPLPGYTQYGTRKIAINGLERLSFLKHAYLSGTVSSGESFSTTAEEWHILRRNHAIAKEMEAAGVVQALQILAFDGPRYVVKALTEVADEHTSTEASEGEFSTNFEMAMSQLSAVIEEMIGSRHLL